MLLSDFNLKATLESGQVFGFKSDPSGFYEGRIGCFDVRISQKGRTLEVEAPAGFSKSHLVDYFDLNRDLNPVYKLLQAEPFWKAVQPIKGLRLIKQDSWEALACFIISSNNNVKRIQGIWANLSQRFSHDKRSFPRPAEIARHHERTLREAGLGYRAPFLLHTAQFIKANPKSLDVIREAPYEEARKRVLSFPGIGPKVADCALLYGFHKLEAFPVDVWILRAMRKIYFSGRKVSESKVHASGRQRWGQMAGYVQQYIFHGARLGMIP